MDSGSDQHTILIIAQLEDKLMQSFHIPPKAKPASIDFGRKSKVGKQWGYDVECGRPSSHLSFGRSFVT